MSQVGILFLLFELFKATHEWTKTAAKMALPPTNVSGGTLSFKTSQTHTGPRTVSIRRKRLTSGEGKNLVAIINITDATGI